MVSARIRTAASPALAGSLPSSAAATPFCARNSSVALPCAFAAVTADSKRVRTGGRADSSRARRDISAEICSMPSR